MHLISAFYLPIRFLARLLNSPAVITVLSLLLGGVVASMLASSYQRKQHIFDLRVQGLKLLLHAQANWLHAHLASQEKESHECYMRLLTDIRYLKVLFPGRDTAEKFKSYHDAAAELGQHFGQKIDATSVAAEDAAIIKFHNALNELTRALVSTLGISPIKGT
jgi:hypothetical protein